jgi:hypothetical protein
MTQGARQWPNFGLELFVPRVPIVFGELRCSAGPITRIVNSDVNSLVNTGAMFWMTQGCGFRDGSRVQHLNRRAGIALRVVSTTPRRRRRSCTLPVCTGPHRRAICSTDCRGIPPSGAWLTVNVQTHLPTYELRPEHAGLVAVPRHDLESPREQAIPSGTGCFRLDPGASGLPASTRALACRAVMEFV